MIDLTLSDACAEAERDLGVTLFTVTVIAPGAAEISRVFSSRTDVYPVGGRKALDPSGTSPLWYRMVIDEQRTFVGADRASVAEFFADASTIFDLGCGSIINTAVVVDGATIGSINFLAPEGILTDAAVPAAEEITRRSAAAVRRAQDLLFAG